MAKLPERQSGLIRAIDKAHEDKTELPRPHFGASLAGHHCDRWLWLNFRWSVIEKFPGRMLRLFRRGQNEEETIVSDLRMAGVDIVDEDENGKQFRVDFGNHLSGSMDGFINSGVPEAPKKKHIAEFKTHSDKSFKQLVKDGVQKSKPMHYAQMQLYMHGTETDRALYVAINKNDDTYYTERVRYDRDFAKSIIERSHRIINSDRMPEPCAGASAEWYQCKFCPAYNFCHVNHWATEVNCRTCAHSTAKEDGTWHCARWNDTIPTSAQYAGCDSHVFHPDLVPWDFIDGDGISAKYKDGNREFWNGEKGERSIDIVRIDMEM